MKQKIIIISSNSKTAKFKQVTGLQNVSIIDFSNLPAPKLAAVAHRQLPLGDQRATYT